MQVIAFYVISGEQGQAKLNDEEMATLRKLAETNPEITITSVIPVQPRVKRRTAKI